MGYLLQHRLGRGGMGVVDLALDPTGRPVALKRLAVTGTPEELERARARLRREVEALRKVRHPAIVPLLDVIDDGDDLVLVMPYLSGGSLADRVESAGPLAPEEVARIAHQLLPALAAMHRRGVVHRDGKPANVLFDADGNAFLTDFGVASLRDGTGGLTATGSVVGTPAFIAPEQARGEEPSAAADVFALGATLYYAATGDAVYGSTDAVTMLRRAAANRIQADLHRVHPSLTRPLSAMLHPDPRQRPSAAQLAGGPQGTDPALRRPPAPPSPAPSTGPPAGRRSLVGTAPPEPALRAHRSRRRLVLASMALLVGLVAAVALVLRASRTADPAFAGALQSEVGPTTTCVPLPYQPCGGRPAPFTDGERCLGSRADFDGDTTNGCEAAPDALDGTRLGPSLEANLVPAEDTDAFAFTVEDGFSLVCDGSVELTLTAPADTSVELTVFDGSRQLATTRSTDGRTARLTLREPQCGSDDGAELTARVRYAPGSDPSAGTYRLTRRGDY